MRSTIGMLFILAVIFQGCIVPESVKRGDDYLINKNYDDALRAYEVGLSEAIDPMTIREIEEKIETVKGYIVNQRLDEAQKIYNSQTPVDVSTIDAAINVLKKARWDDAQGRIALKLNMLKKEKQQIKRKKQQQIEADIDQKRVDALQAAGNFDYEQAEALIQQAFMMAPTDATLTEVQQEILEKKRLYQEIAKNLNDGDFETAQNVFMKLVGKNQFVAKLAVFPLKEQFVELMTQKVREFKRQNRWYEAFKYLNPWPIDLFQNEIYQIRTAGSLYYLNAAKEAVKYEKNPHKGYIYALKATELSPLDNDIFNMHKVTQDDVKLSMQRYIAVASFDSPSDDPDAGKQFSDSLISYLYQVLPFGINILERDKIDYILEERKSEVRPTGDILGVDLMVTGTVSLYRVDQAIDKRTATVRFKTGTQVVENPLFIQMVRMYGTNMSLWPQKIPAKTIEKDIYQIVSYQKGTAQKKGFAKVSVRIFDTKKGTITFVKDFDASIVRSSEFQDEVSAADISYKPIKLPTVTEIKEEMRKSIVVEIAKVVRSSFQNREQRFLNQAQYHLDRLEYDAALKPLAEGYLYCEIDNIKSENEAYTKMRELIDMLVGRQDLIPKTP